MAAACGASLHICALRVTKLDAVGNVASESNNSYVTNQVMQVQLNPNILAGIDSDLVGGCDCVLASYRGVDKLKRFEFQVDMGAMEPILVAMLIGAAQIADATDIVGVAWPAPVECGSTPPNVAVEFWTDHWVEDAPDPVYPYIHHVYPSSYWQIGQQTFQNDFARPPLNGFSRKNPQWGAGPYGDGPPDSEDISRGGWWKTADVPPEADCLAASVTPSS